MQVKYRVHSSASFVDVRKVDLPGVGEVDANVPSFLVELVPLDMNHGTIKLVWVGANIEVASEMFELGGEVVASFTLSKEE